MKCNHDVKSNHWEKCSKCGKLVRINRKREIMGWVLLIAFTWLVVPAIADWGVHVLHMNDYNPHNITHAFIGCIPILAVCFLIRCILPLYDEKEQE